MKPVVKIRDVQIVPAERIFGLREEGNFVAVAVLAETDHRGWEAGTDVRTSMIVNVDIVDGTIETLNTIYEIVV